MDFFSCSIFPRCPGCKFQKNIIDPPVIHRATSFFGRDIPLISREITGWRSKAKLAVRGSSLHPQIGLFEENSHTVVEMKECPLHYPVMNEALDLIYKKMIHHGIEPYREDNNTGRLRYLQMVVDRKTLKLQLSLVFNAKSLTEQETLFVKQLYKEGGFWHSIWGNFQFGCTNTILSSRWELFCGEEDFWQEIKGISFNFHPSSFSQAHLSVFEEMLNVIELYIPSRSNLLELYAGVGCISLSAGLKASKLLLVESSPLSKACFLKTLSSLPKEVSQKCEFLLASVEETVFPSDVDTIIVDPPRKGLSQRCKEKIFTSNAKQLIYVSCGPDSLFRDCKEIVERGWFVDDVKGFLFFPGLDHVELLVNFKKQF